MAEMAKFLFDTVFDPEEATLQTAPARPEKTYWSTDERNTARDDGFARGKQAGIEEANATMSAALQAIASGVNALTSQLETQREQLKSEGIVLANMIAGSLSAALIKREPMHEIEALFGEALNFLPDTPHIAVRIHEDLLEIAKEKLDVIAVECGFQGKLILLGQPDIGVGDCRIEWAQGGIVKDQAQVKKRIREIITQHIEASLMPDEDVFEGIESPVFTPTDTNEGSNSPESFPDQTETAGLPEEK